MHSLNRLVKHIAKHIARHSLNADTHAKMCSNVSFSGELDRYEGMHVKLMASDTHWHDMSDKQFNDALNESLLEWTANKCRVSWFEVPIELSKLIPLLVSNGYVYHHARPAYVVMNKWLSASEPNNIPGYAFTNVGVGGLVVDRNDRVLVVKERHFIGKQMWKFPGGYANQDEDFGATAVREVLEETGVLCAVESVLALRQFHRFAFDCSDLYVVCHLRPETDTNHTNYNDIDIKKCDQEIADCQWIDIHELRPQLSKFNAFIVDKFLSYRKSGVAIKCDQIDSIPPRPPFTVYTIATTSQ